VSTEQFLAFSAVVIALGGVIEVFRRYLIAPLVKGLRLIEKLARDVADLLDRTSKIEDRLDSMGDDVAEIKGALKATGILPDDGK